MAARSAYVVSRREQWQYAVKTWLPGILAGLFCVTTVIYFFGIAPSRDLADVAGAAIQHGKGVVSSVTYLPVTKGNTSPPAVTSVVIGGSEATFRTYAPVHTGAHVEVAYRMGKSGQIHIDDIRPDGDTRP